MVTIAKTNGSGCGHTAVAPEGHTGYLHDGHLHRVHGDHVVECTIAMGVNNPAACTPSHVCEGHNPTHVRGPAYGHEAVPHGDHSDYRIAGHLHYLHSGRCDDHGPLG